MAAAAWCEERELWVSAGHGLGRCSGCGRELPVAQVGAEITWRLPRHRVRVAAAVRKARTTLKKLEFGLAYGRIHRPGEWPSYLRGATTMSQMLNLGNGAESVARLYSHVSELFETFKELCGLQQCHLGPNPMHPVSLDAEWRKYEADTHQLLTRLANDLGFDAQLTATFPPCARRQRRKRA
jgi:hypothetical protein